MSLAALPGQIFAHVVAFLYPRANRTGMDRHRHQNGHENSSLTKAKHDAKGPLQGFSTLSKALHTLVRRTPEICFHAKKTGSGQLMYRPALALGVSELVNDGRVASLLASSFHSVAAKLLFLDLRVTAITEVSTITILQTCPLLEELDVGEYQGIDVLELARRPKRCLVRA